VLLATHCPFGYASVLEGRTEAYRIGRRQRIGRGLLHLQDDLQVI